MTIEEAWNMLTYCVGEDEGKSHEIKVNQSSIEEQRMWRRKLCALKITKRMFGDEAEGIVEVMLKQIKSQSKGQQSDWMRYPRKIEGIRKYGEENKWKQTCRK